MSLILYAEEEEIFTFLPIFLLGTHLYIIYIIRTEPLMGATFVTNHNNKHSMTSHTQNNTFIIFFQLPASTKLPTSLLFLECATGLKCKNGCIYSTYIEIYIEMTLSLWHQEIEI